MKSLVLFYSYSGHTKAIAEQLAEKESADIAEIEDLKRPCKLKAYTAGCFKAMLGKPWPIIPPLAELENFDKIYMLAPVWAGNPPPAFNAVLELLPTGKKISVTMVSASGKSDCRERLEEIIKGKGCVLESFEDIKV